MRPLTRQSARLASSSRARAPSVPRNRCERQRRSFHISSQRSSDPRTPGSSDHTPISGLRDSTKGAGVESERHDEGAELENGEAKISSFPRPGRSRTTLRQRRMNDVPKPPPIPDWFLKHNVRLVEERPSSRWKEDEVYPTIRCVDTETGHTLFTVDHWDPVGKPSNSEKARDERQTAIDSTGSTAMAGTATLEQHFFDQKNPLISGDDAEQTTKSTTETQKTQDSPFQPPSYLRRMVAARNWDREPMRWPLLEAEASARAALSLPNENQPLSLFATDRVDLSLECPDPNSHDQMHKFVHGLARVVGADVIKLDANDLAELSDEYVGQGDDTPGSFSNLGYEVFDGYVASGVPTRVSLFRSPSGRNDENEFDDEDDPEEDSQNGDPSGGFGHTLGIEDIKKALQSSSFGKILGGRIVGIPVAGSLFGQRPAAGSRDRKRPSVANGSDGNRDDARLSALLDNLLNASSEKRAASTTPSKGAIVHKQQVDGEDTLPLPAGVASFRSLTTWRQDTSILTLAHLGSVLQGDDATKFPYRLVQGEPNLLSSTEDAAPKTIIYIRDLRDITESKLGDNIIRRLSKVVSKRRRGGERIMIVGATSQDVPGLFTSPGDPHDDFPFRTITVPPTFSFQEADGVTPIKPPRLDDRNLDNPTYGRILEINLRHIQSMLRRMKPEQDVDICSPVARKQLNMPGMHFLSERVLPLDQVQRLALTAVGLMQTHARADIVHPVHVALAAFITTRADHVQQAWSLIRDKKDAKRIQLDLGAADLGRGKQNEESSSARIDRIKKSLNQHETRLLTGVVDAEKIKVCFSDVHAVPETIDALKTVTSLSLLRPDAFKYGVLANDRLPGLLLYGPPGTGKTLLAKAVAKESKATVLEVSGAQIYEKYVGEGEKMVRAVFSLAKKLSPCVVFIDEADAIFGSRSNAGNRNTHREIINQFLREWDGMDDHGCFMMVATNRPFDLDDAVLRRLPRRLLVDLPVAKDRESILGIHLRNEALDESVSLAKLAEQTPFYSGSDLKNLSVAAALACVREENELAELRKEDTEFKLPEKRTLTSKHFEKALSEVSASVSEDMSSLTAIRKFDEQFGDRKGRRKKMGYGFGLADVAVDESAVRVRQDSSPSAPPP